MFEFELQIPSVEAVALVSSGPELSGGRNAVFTGNVVSAIVFWPLKNEKFTATSFLLICLAVLDNIMLSLYYVLMGLTHTCRFYDSCQYYMKVHAHNEGVHCTHLIAVYMVS